MSVNSIPCPSCHGSGVTSARGKRKVRQCGTCRGDGHRDRLPVEPLADFLGAETPWEVALQLGLHRTTVLRWYQMGGIPWERADELAQLQLREHPVRIWGEETWALVGRRAA